MIYIVILKSFDLNHFKHYNTDAVVLYGICGCALGYRRQNDATETDVATHNVSMKLFSMEKLPDRNVSQSWRSSYSNVV